MEKGDFVLIELEGKTKGVVFDSTKGEIAKKLHGKEGPLLIVYGKAVLLPGIVEALKDMKEGEEKNIVLKPEKAFGKRKKELIKVFSISAFKDRKNELRKGATLFFENNVTGIVKSISNGRVMIDFNHPLAGKTVEYWIKVVKIIKDKEEKLKALLKELGIKKYEIKENKVVLGKEDADKLEVVKANVAFLIGGYDVIVNV